MALFTCMCPQILLYIYLTRFGAQFCSSNLNLSCVAPIQFIPMNTAPQSSSEKSTEFPDTQKAFLKSFIPEYEQYIAENNPDHKPRSKELKEWRSKKANLLMQDSLIQVLVQNSAVEARDWEMVSSSLCFQFGINVIIYRLSDVFF